MRTAATATRRRTRWLAWRGRSLERYFLIGVERKISREVFSGWGGEKDLKRGIFLS